MEIIDADWEKIAEKKDECFYCGFKKTITYHWKIMFKIECDQCGEYSYY